MNQKESDKYYIKVAKACAENSKAVKLQVGAVIVKDNQIISDGFNGTPSGFDNNCEYLIPVEGSNLERHYGKKVTDDTTIRYIRSQYSSEEYRLETKPEVLHAESNAITKCAKSGRASEGATIYITHSPCLSCAKLIVQAGIKRVVYADPYRNEDGVNLLKQAGINVERYE